MSGEEEDTDTKLAILASLLEPANYPLEELLEALQGSNGDVGLAAEAILLPRVRGAGKRKAGTSLESWLGKKRVSVSPDKPSTPAIKADHPSPSAGVKKNEGVNLMDHLKQPIATKKSIPRPAIHLPNQSSIDTHKLPLSILQSPLSPAFASALYLAMMEESTTWERNRFYLAGKWVESPHTVCHYSRDPAATGTTEAKEKGEEILDGKEGKKATYMWSGQEIAASRLYPALLREAAEMIEPVVDAALRNRKRYPYEWAGHWEASVCGANRYDGAGSGVGWHADQLTYLGPYTTIASLSLGTPRAFRLRQTDSIIPTTTEPTRTYEMTLAHNSLVLMNAGCQERYKHTVPTAKALDLFRPGYNFDQSPIPVQDQKTYTSRINITFRFYRPDFHPTPDTGLKPRQGTPYCKCGIPTLLRADQKAKARSYMSGSPTKKQNGVAQETPRKIFEGREIVDDDMVFFWQCQAPGQTGDMKGCGFFRILDMKGEGRGPCIIDSL